MDTTQRKESQSKSKDASIKLKALTSRLSYPSNTKVSADKDAKPLKIGRSNNNILSSRLSRTSKSSLKSQSSQSKVKYRSVDEGSDKKCKDRFQASFSAWDGKLRHSNTNPGRETNFGLFRRAHIRAHKRIRDTYDPLDYYFCAIE